MKLNILDIIGILVGIAGAVIFVGTLYLMIEDSKSPSLVLKKSEWRCTKTEPYMIMQPFPDGRGGVTLMPMSSSRCVEYRSN